MSSVFQTPSAQPSILDRIIDQRRKDIEEAKEKVPLSQLQQIIEANRLVNRFSIVDFHQKLLKNSSPGRVAVIAEVKRASPSKGDIAPDIDASKQVFL